MKGKKRIENQWKVEKKYFRMVGKVFRLSVARKLCDEREDKCWIINCVEDSEKLYFSYEPDIAVLALRYVM